MITVCCLKLGTKYGPEYVNVLESMVRRNVVSAPYEFVCFTDDAAGIRPEIGTAPLPCELPGMWAKMALYMPEILSIDTERLLFLDLDIVVTGNLDGLMCYESDFAMAKDWPSGMLSAEDHRNVYGNTSVVLLKTGAAARLWDAYRASGFPTHGYGDGDQGWINHTFPGAADLLPEKMVQSYKMHHLEGDTPPSCDIVMFHGTPKPHECGGWVKGYWQ